MPVSVCFAGGVRNVGGHNAAVPGFQQQFKQSFHTGMHIKFYPGKICNIVLQQYQRKLVLFHFLIFNRFRSQCIAVHDNAVNRRIHQQIQPFQLLFVTPVCH